MKNVIGRKLKRIAVIVIISSALTGCYSFFPPRLPLTIEQARSIVANDGYKLVNIGFTINRPVDKKTFYGLCKDGKGNEFAYWVDTKTKSLRTVQLGVDGYQTYEQMSNRLEKQGQLVSNVRNDLFLELSATNTFYWQYTYTGQTWDLKGESIKVSSPKLW